jgi:predicted MFS family arabinose efflux permease
VAEKTHDNEALRRSALKFVLITGVVSLFADFTYEGSRSITGPFLQTLGATGAIVGIVAGLGELFGYGLRFVSGRISERTGEFWPITFFGYIVQMTAVPLLALAGSWKTAALLILFERIGKAIRNPPRDVMISHAAKEIGFGWGFGIHEALDQFGALLGPLLIAMILARRGEFRMAFATLVVPAVITLLLLFVARLLYPRPEDLEAKAEAVRASGLPRIFWIYLAAAALVSAGFADFQLIAFHFQKVAIVKTSWIPVFYSVAMGVSGAGSLVFGRLFDRYGIAVLIPLTFLSALFAPLVFLGGFWLALLGAALWGLGMGVHESIIPAAVATMVPAERRPSAYGLFTGAYGLFWFAGSAIIGILYDRSITAVIVFCVLSEFAAIPVLLRVHRRMAT